MAPGTCDRGFLVAVEHAGKAEIGQEGTAITINEDVRWLDVTVEDAALVGVLDAECGLLD